MNFQECTLKIAVTGATGFIGRHVLAELAPHNIKIIAVARPGQKDLPVLINGEWVTIDICYPPTNVYEAMGTPDVLIHLAWHGLPNYLSLHHFETELPLQYTFLKQMVLQGLKTFVVAGTCFEYGMQSGQLIEDMVTKPNNPYGFAKDILRRQLEYLKEDRPFSLAWARLFYTYGAGQAESSLFSQLKSAVERGDKVFNMSGGEQLRDYLPVAEIAKHLVSFALSGEDIGVVNTCSGIPISVRKLVENWIEKYDWEINLNLDYYPYPDYEPMAFWGDRRKLDRIMVSK